MRRRLAVLVAATTSVVIIALFIPLAMLLEDVAEERVLGVSAERATRLLTVAMTSSAQDIRGNVETYFQDNPQPPGTATALVVPVGSVLRPEGAVIGSAPDSLTDPGVRDALATGRSFSRSVPGGMVTYRTATGPLGTFVARDQVDDDILHQGVLRSTLIVVGLGVLLLGLAVLAADWMARRVAEPIQEVVQAADAMREGDLDLRLEEHGMPEVVSLARALNRLAERIGRLLSAERDAVADLSHRLRTPVTALRLDTEMITDPDLGERLRTHITSLERTVDAIVHDAKRPSRADAVGRCDAAKIVRERVAFWSALAEEQGRPLRTAVPERPLMAKVAAGDLTDVVDVLLDNVFAYTEDGVPIEVWVVPRADGAIVLTVEDGGPGLPAGDIVSRGRSGAGSSGLGLDICRRAAMASGGWLELGQSRLGGALVRVVLGKATA